MTAGEIGGMGRSGFIARPGLWDDAQGQAAAGLVLRGKTLVMDMLESVLRSGCSMTSTLLLKDTAHRTVYPVWQSDAGQNIAQMTGASDLVLVPDPTTFRLLPWVPGTAWMLADVYYQTGLPVPFSTRSLCRSPLAQLGEAGYRYLAGLELELYLFKFTNPCLDPHHC